MLVDSGLQLGDLAMHFGFYVRVEQLVTVRGRKPFLFMNSLCIKLVWRLELFNSDFLYYLKYMCPVLDTQAWLWTLWHFILDLAFFCLYEFHPSHVSSFLCETGIWRPKWSGEILWPNARRGSRLWRCCWDRSIICKKHNLFFPCYIKSLFNFSLTQIALVQVFDLCRKSRALAVLFRRGRTPPQPENLQLNLRARKRSLED